MFKWIDNKIDRFAATISAWMNRPSKPKEKKVSVLDDLLKPRGSRTNLSEFSPYASYTSFTSTMDPSAVEPVGPDKNYNEDLCIEAIKRYCDSEKIKYMASRNPIYDSTMLYLEKDGAVRMLTIADGKPYSEILSEVAENIASIKNQLDRQKGREEEYFNGTYF